MDVSGLRREPLTAIPLASVATGPRPPVDKQGATYQPTDNVSKTMLGSATPTAALVESLTDPPAGVAAARHRLEAVILPEADGASPYGQVERLSLRPNEYRFYWRENEASLTAAIRENQTLVAKARQQLDGPQQADFDRLWKLTADDIGARAALQLLLLEGSLTTGTSSDNRRLLDELMQLADPDQALVAGFDRTALVCDLMQEIAFPSSISQQSKGTCTVTTAQILMAMARPAEYARIVRQLAAAEVTPVTLADGAQWEREPGTDTDDGSERTVPSRLFQAAAMEAQRADADYDNETDKHTLPDGTRTGGGGTTTLAHVVKSLLGPTAYAEPFYQGDCGGAEGLATAVIQAAQAGHPSLVALYSAESAEASGSGAAHEILVIDATDDGIRFINPWGQTETATKEALTKMVLGAVFVNLDAPAPPIDSLVARAPASEIP